MEKYIPDMYQESIFKVNFDKLKESGIKTILVDVDNTLIEYGGKEPEDNIKKLIEELKEKFNIVIYSNSSKKRVNYIKEIFDIDGFYKVRKPLKKGFMNILEKYKLKVSEVAIIGDQMMTDVLGGNRVGITTILVNPINSSNEPIWTRFNRHFEKGKMRKLREKSLFTKGRFYD